MSLTTRVPAGTRAETGDPLARATLPSVLLVDDQAGRLLSYEAILANVGVNCVRAMSGEEALKQLLKYEFAVIVLDVSMPGMDGFETARLIREHPRLERTPIIFVTGVHISELDRLTGYEVGAIDYISVPIVPEILRSKVVLLVELYNRRAELSSLNRELEAARARLEVERNKAIADRSDLLKEREEHYRAIFEHPTELVVVLEAIRTESGQIVDWRYRDANTNALKLLQRSREDLIGAYLGEVLPNRAAHSVPLLNQVLQQRAPHRYETTVGETDFLICLFPIGENTVVSSGVDITTRKRAELDAQRQSAETRAENEWLAAVLNSMNEEVYFTDTQGRYLYANPAAMREFGHASVEGIGVEQIVAKLEVFRADGTPRPIEEAPPLRSLRGEVIRGEEQIVRIPRTGELRNRQVSSAPVRNAGGDIIGAVFGGAGHHGPEKNRGATAHARNAIGRARGARRPLPNFDFTW
jgi:PAS domain S-box-containing protein